MRVMYLSSSMALKLLREVAPGGIEPPSEEPESSILSIKLRSRCDMVVPSRIELLSRV